MNRHLLQLGNMGMRQLFFIIYFSTRTGIYHQSPGSVPSTEGVEAGVDLNCTHATRDRAKPTSLTKTFFTWCVNIFMVKSYHSYNLFLCVYRRITHLSVTILKLLTASSGK